MTKTISIYIFLEDEPSVECITAGNSAEHNATTLKFILESTFTDEFKYYLDFVLPNGKILRTDYLPLDKNDENSVSFDVPASVTKYGTAECCLNAVKIDENGITTEVMKPKNIILYFNTLADADGALLSDYDFSVNTMLENIKNGVFKGEKGDKGDNGKDGSNYILTEKDKKEIAALINKRTYGLPYTRRVSGENTLTLTDSLAMPFNGFTVYGKTSVTGSYGGTEEPASSVKISGVSSVKIGINGAEQTVNTGSELFSAGDYADKADVISGIFTRKIGKYALTGNAQTVLAKSYTSGGVTLNRIYTPTPGGAKMVRGTCLPGYCTHFEVFTDNITSDEELGARISAGENYIGVMYGYSNDVIYFLTTLSVDRLKSYLQSQYAAGTPVTVYYPLASESEENITAAALNSEFPTTEITVSKPGGKFDICYCADISEAVKRLEEK